jgi:hypothetical protein
VGETLYRYPDEPHPDNRVQWKFWWMHKCGIDIHETLSLPQGNFDRARVMDWVHQCWQTTMATWHLRQVRAA